MKAYIRENKLEQKLGELDLINSWEQVLGKTVASYTKNLSIRNKVLFVETSSPIVRNELIMIRQDIIRRLNEEVGQEIIQKIVIS